MAIAYDAESESGVDTAGTHSWTHTPSGTPRGVVVVVAQEHGGGSDDVTGVTYGGTSMTRVDFAEDTSAEMVKAWSYFLGASVPTGSQTVAVTVAATSANLRCACYTVTASADTVVDANGVAEENQANPTITLATTASTNTFCCGALASGRGGVAQVVPAGDLTELLEYDFGATTCSLCRRTSIATGGNIDIGWTSADDDVAAVAVAVKETGGAPAATAGRLVSGGLVNTGLVNGGLVG